MSTTETIKDDEKGIDVTIIRQFIQNTTTPRTTSSLLTVNDIKEESNENKNSSTFSNQNHDWFQKIIDNTRWYRVKYKSCRFEKECETPCWTAFFGGRSEYKPYKPIPNWLKPLVEKVSSEIGVNSDSPSRTIKNDEENVIQFNAILLRLYFDGNDEIAWHTDGRTFLGDNPTICSLSFGADATFQMRRMNNVWPPVGGGGACSGESYVDQTTRQHNFVLGDGDLLVMKGQTQKHWHHRVPKQKGRKPRLNINFRYIQTGKDAQRGQQTYYKYMVHGDEDFPKSLTFSEILNQRGGIMKFLKNNQSTLTTTVKSQTQQKLNKPTPSSTAGLAVREEKKEQNLKVFEKNHNNGDHIQQQPSEQSLSSTSTIHDNQDAYNFLQSNPNIDESTFLALPVQFRTELINEWKETQIYQKQKRKYSQVNTFNHSNANISLFNSGKRSKKKNEKRQNTIQNFFKSC